MDAEAKRRRRGLVIVYTGDGKGKTTAAMGLALRAAGNRLPVRVIQFIKGDWKSGERTLLESGAVPGLEIATAGRGFTVAHLRNPRIPMDEHQLAFEAGWAAAEEAVTSQRYRLVVLDEILGAVRAGLVSEDQLCELIRRRPAPVHLVLTGRGGLELPQLVALADMVSEVVPHKHHYRDQGIPAQRGIEF